MELILCNEIATSPIADRVDSLSACFMMLHPNSETYTENWVSEYRQTRDGKFAARLTLQAFLLMQIANGWMPRVNYFLAPYAVEQSFACTVNCSIENFALLRNYNGDFAIWNPKEQLVFDPMSGKKPLSEYSTMLWLEFERCDILKDNHYYVGD
jgi:hypothetical protein